MSAPARSNLGGGLWLILDMALNIWALSIVKALGLGYGAAQLVFLRALVGLVVISPWIWAGRRNFRNLPDPAVHLARVCCSVIALSGSYFALARVPLALFTAIGFTRPLVTMIMAAIFLHEAIGPRRWLAAALALIGIGVAVNPSQLGGGGAGLAALAVVVIAASGAVILTRALRDVPKIVLMALYAGGLALVTGPFALAGWTTIQPGHLIPLLAIGLFATLAQLCFLRAHQLGDAGFLSVLSYLSLIFSVSTGYLIFGEAPGLNFFIGAALVIAAALWVTLEARRVDARGGRII